MLVHRGSLVREKSSCVCIPPPKSHHTMWNVLFLIKLDLLFQRTFILRVLHVLPYFSTK